MNSYKKLSSFIGGDALPNYKHNSNCLDGMPQNVPRPCFRNAYIFIAVSAFLIVGILAYRYLPVLPVNRLTMCPRFTLLLCSETILLLPSFAVGALCGWSFAGAFSFGVLGCISGFFFKQFEGSSVWMDACLLLVCGLRWIAALLTFSLLKKGEKWKGKMLDITLLSTLVVLLAFIKLIILENFT